MWYLNVNVPIFRRIANIYFLHAIKVCIFKRKLCGFWYLNRARKRNTVTGTLHFFQPRDIDVCLCRSNPPRKNKSSDRHRVSWCIPWFPYGDKIAEYSWLMIDYENPWSSVICDGWGKVRKHHYFPNAKFQTFLLACESKFSIISYGFTRLGTFVHVKKALKSGKRSHMNSPSPLSSSLRAGLLGCGASNGTRETSQRVKRAGG